MGESSGTKVKVFISWSGEPSQAVAKSLRNGIRTVFDMVVPFVSQVDIDAGTRGLQVIEEALQGSAFGVIVVTPENMSAPWLNFEAGALSKALENAEVRVVPLLVGIPSASQLSGPLSQFQARSTAESSIRDLFYTIGDVVQVEREIIDSRLDGWLSSFHSVVDSVQGDPKTAIRKRSSEDQLDELLLLVRDMRREINDLRRREHGDSSWQAEKSSFKGAVAHRVRSLLSAVELSADTILQGDDGQVLVRLTTPAEQESLDWLHLTAATLGIEADFFGADPKIS